MYKGIKVEKGHGKIKFPARALLLEHRKYGLILVDTGYGPGVYARGVLAFIYNLVNPTCFVESVSIHNQLKLDGIMPEQVKQIILTHLHPDHLGGAVYFSASKFILSEKARKSLEHPRRRDAIFQNMADTLKTSRLETVCCEEKTPLEGFIGKDIFGDGSLWVIELEGHAYGQLGVYVPELALFYVADATWSIKHMCCPLKPAARQIQHDMKAYKDTIRKLNALNNIQLLCTHDETEVLRI